MAVIIRPATVDDIPAMLPAARAYFDASGYNRFVVYCEDTTAATFKAFIENDSAALFIAVSGEEVIGGISGVLVPLYFSRTVALQQVFWFVSPSARLTEPLAGGLVARRLLKWGAEQGVDIVIAGALGGDDESKPGLFWRRIGLIPVERQYWGLL